MSLLLAPMGPGHADWMRAVPVDDLPVRPITLTQTQMSILAFVAGAQRDRGTTPTFREIAQAVDLHRSTVAYQVDRMTQMGVFGREPGSLRAILIKDVPVQLG